MRSMKSRGSASAPPERGGQSSHGATIVITTQKWYQPIARGLFNIEQSLIGVALGVALRFQELDLRKHCGFPPVTA
jgi:hypothetical protein